MSKRKKKVNSKQKGSRVERDLVKFLKENGCPSARRTEQYCGASGDAADVVADELSHYHIECKGTKSKVLNYSTLTSWLEQIKRDCPKYKVPVIFWKANNAEWIVIQTDLTRTEITLYLDSKHQTNVMKIANEHWLDNSLPNEQVVLNPTPDPSNVLV